MSGQVFQLHIWLKSQSTLAKRPMTSGGGVVSWTRILWVQSGASTDWTRSGMTDQLGSGEFQSCELPLGTTHVALIPLGGPQHHGHQLSGRGLIWLMQWLGGFYGSNNIQINARIHRILHCSQMISDIDFDLDTYGASWFHTAAQNQPKMSTHTNNATLW